MASQLLLGVRPVQGLLLFDVLEGWASYEISIYTRFLACPPAVAFSLDPSVCAVILVHPSQHKTGTEGPDEEAGDTPHTYAGAIFHILGAIG